MLRFFRLASMALPAALWLVRKFRERRTGARNPTNHPTSVHNSRDTHGRPGGTPPAGPSN